VLHEFDVTYSGYQNKEMMSIRDTNIPLPLSVTCRPRSCTENSLRA
jgi:hypothetical protein